MRGAQVRSGLLTLPPAPIAGVSAAVLAQAAMWLPVPGVTPVDDAITVAALSFLGNVAFGIAAHRAWRRPAARPDALPIGGAAGVIGVAICIAAGIRFGPLDRMRGLSAVAMTFTGKALPALGGRRLRHWRAARSAEVDPAQRRQRHGGAIRR